MSLFIYGKKSRIKYHSSYREFHQIRYLSYLICRGKKSFGDYMSSHILPKNTFHFFGSPDPGAEKEWIARDIYMADPHVDDAFLCAWSRFPNLNQHSDCEGSYTPDGQIDITSVKRKHEMLTGSSIQLLKELEVIKRFKLPLRKENWESFAMLYRLVKSEVGKGGSLFLDG